MVRSIKEYEIRQPIIVEYELKRPNYSKIEISFRATEKEFKELHSAIKTYDSNDKFKIVTILCSGYGKRRQHLRGKYLGRTKRVI